MPKPNIRKDIQEAKQVLKELMKEHLIEMSGDYIARIMRKVRNGTEATRLNAIKDLELKGLGQYKRELLEALAVVASDALKQAKKEVPKGKIKLTEDEENSLKLGMWENLPPKVRKRLALQAQLIIDAQKNGLKQSVNSQFIHSVDSTDSYERLQADLMESASDWIDGAPVEAGAGSIASQVVNETRNAFFFDDGTLGEIECFQFVNGDPVSPICQDLAGTYFDKNDPDMFRYTPPLHFNCKSYIVPVLKGNLPRDAEVKKLKPSTAALDNSIRFGEHYCCEDHQSISVDE